MNKQFKQRTKRSFLAVLLIASVLCLSACAQKPSYQAVVVSDDFSEGTGIYCVQIADNKPASGLFILTVPADAQLNPENFPVGTVLDVYGSETMTMSLPGLANCEKIKAAGQLEGEELQAFLACWDEFAQHAIPDNLG